MKSVRFFPKNRFLFFLFSYYSGRASQDDYIKAAELKRPMSMKNRMCK